MAATRPEQTTCLATSMEHSDESDSAGSTKSLSKIWGTDMVDVFVGSERRRFVLHKDLLCAQSPYFGRMFNGHLEEAALQSCELQAPEDSPEGFEVFLSWLYRGILPANYEAIAGTGTFAALASFCILADKLLLAKEVKVQALDALVKAYLTEDAKFELDCFAINSALLTTAEDCPLRHLIVEMMWDHYAKPDVDSAWLSSCLHGVSTVQIAKICQVMKDENLLLSEFKAGLFREIFKKGRSIAKIKRYQKGMLKVASEAAKARVVEIPVAAKDC